jgi:flagellar biosynthesis component FlhA
MLDEVPFEGGAVNPTRLLCLASADALSAAFFGRASDARLDATAATLPDGSGRAACWIPVARGAEARAAGYETLDAAAYIAIHLRSLLVANLELFAGLEEIERSLSEVAGAGEAAGGTLLGRVKAAKGGLPRFAEVARSLLMDELPIEPMGRVASRYLELAGRPDAEIAEELRLLPAVNAHLTRDVAGWRLLVLAQDYEARVRAGIRREGTDAVLVLQPEHAQELYAGVRSELEAAEGGERSVVVVEDASLRPFIHSMLLVEFPRLLVVARRELQGLGELPAPTATVGAGA